MRFYRTINAKLSLLAAVAAGAALLFSCVAFVINNVQTIRASKVRELSTLATILGANTSAAVEFNDAKMARETLAPLRRQPAVEFACLYDGHGKLFATYPAELPQGFSAPPAPLASGTVFVGSDRLDIAEKVVSGGDTLNTLYLRKHARLAEADLEFRVDNADGAGGFTGGFGDFGSPAAEIRDGADLIAGRSHAASDRGQQLLGSRDEFQQGRDWRAQRGLQHDARPDPSQHRQRSRSNRSREGGRRYANANCSRSARKASKRRRRPCGARSITCWR